MLPWFVRQALPAAVFWPLCSAWAFTEWRGYQTMRPGPQTEECDGESLRFIIWGVWLSIALGSFLTLTLPQASLRGHAVAIAFWIGVGLLTAGVALRRYAVHSLGQFFIHEVVIHAEHRVVDRGPYRWIRHPAYSGTFMALIGVGLALGNWAALLGILIMPVLAYANRVTIEERTLVRALGQEYRSYMRRTRRFIPFVF
jgi:protein-S-isoprenylcysteine O-methyltransferase Ste14